MSSSTTKPWYETAFQADYVERYAHRNDGEAKQAVDLILDNVPLQKNHRVLDLCCGAGRHSLAFCQAGYTVIGLDLSMDLLRSASSRPCDHVLGYARGDMRHLPFPGGTFFAVVHLFTAFGYFDEDSENEAVFAGINQILEPGGYYFFDFLNARNVISELQNGSLETLDEQKGETIHAVKTLTKDQKRVHKTITITDEESDDSFTIREDVRLFNDDELRAMFDRNGFSVEKEFGDYTGQLYRPNFSKRYMVLLRKK